MSTWVSVDGTITPQAEARIAAVDHGVTVGDGLFETMKVVDATPFALTRHLRRLHRSAELLGLHLPWSDAELTETCDRVIAAAAADAANAARGVGRLRLTVTGGPGPMGSDRGEATPTLIAAAGPADPWPPTASVAVVEWTRNETGAVAGAKTTSYAENVVALAEAHRRGADEALFTNTRGALCEGTGSNLFLEVGGVLCTPSLSTGCLAGITRELVCESVPVTERDDLTVADLRHTTEAFVTSSTRDVQPIGVVDGRALPEAPGPLSRAAADAFAAVAARTLDP